MGAKSTAKKGRNNNQQIKADIWSVVIFAILTASSALFYFGISSLLVFFGTTGDTGVAGTFSRSIQMAVAFFSLGLTTLVNYSAKDEENIVIRVLWTRVILLPILIGILLGIQYWLSIPLLWILAFFVLGASLLQTQIYLDAAINKPKNSLFFAFIFYGSFFTLFGIVGLDVYAIPWIGAITGGIGIGVFLFIHRKTIFPAVILTKFHIRTALFFYLDSISYNLLLLDQLLIVDILGEEKGGIYEWNTVIARSILLLSAAVYTLAMRRFLAMKKEKNTAQKKQFIYLLALTMIISILAIGAMIGIYALIFKLEIAESIYKNYLLLVILVTTSLLWNMNSVLSAYLFSRTNFYLSPVTNIIGVVIMVILLTVLLPIHGILIAAIATLVAGSIVFMIRLGGCIFYLKSNQ